MHVPIKQVTMAVGWEREASSEFDAQVSVSQKENPQVKLYTWLVATTNSAAMSSTMQVPGTGTQVIEG